jgi:hypothetical protein
MKRNLFLILAVLTLFYVSCKKDAVKTGTLSSAESYMPVTSGSTWTYFDALQNGFDTITVKMNTIQTTVNGKTYYTANTTTTGQSEVGAIYFYQHNHVYSTRSFNYYANQVLELELYNDTASVGYHWISSPSDNGTIDNVPVRTLTTLRNKGETKGFFGKTYTNVAHTEVDIQYNFGSGWETVYQYDYYFSKGVGILGFNLNALGGLVETEGIMSYNVK